MKPVNLILGTMTFGESVFSPDVETFINAFLYAGYPEGTGGFHQREGHH